MRLFLFLAALGPLLFSCGEDRPTQAEPRTGAWRMELDLGGPVLPILFDLSKSGDSSWHVAIHNGNEEIAVDEVALHSDTMVIRMPLFDSEFIGVVLNDSVIEGAWHNYLKGPEYRIPFRAEAGLAQRFAHTAKDDRIAGSWETHFSRGTPEAYNAIGLFESDARGVVTGTFMTETGDYRFLEGGVAGDSLHLSCFDGSHAFLFEAALRGDSLVGRYWSGTHWQEPWVAVRNADYALRDADSLTHLREGYDMVDFSFPDTEGNMVSTSDDAFRNKVLMVQVMGSWCPNCVDEARLLAEVHQKYHERGLEVVAVAFEKHEDPKRSVEGLRRFKDALALPYPVLYGGTASKEVAGSKLPFLDHLMSYPTCIFIDRSGVVRRIRTGFYGPGTGDHYVHYKRNLDAFLDGLLNEGTSVAQR